MWRVANGLDNTAIKQLDEVWLISNSALLLFHVPLKLTCAVNHGWTFDFRILQSLYHAVIFGEKFSLSDLLFNNAGSKWSECKNAVLWFLTILFLRWHTGKKCLRTYRKIVFMKILPQSKETLEDPRFWWRGSWQAKVIVRARTYLKEILALSILSSFSLYIIFF
jgi:hypothetical protein